MRREKIGLDDLEAYVCQSYWCLSMQLHFLQLAALSIHSYLVRCRL